MTQTVRFDPVQVTLIAAAEIENDELGRVVRMFGENEFFQRLDVRGSGFEQDEKLGAAFDFSLPPIMRFKFWNEIGAGHQPRFQSCASKRSRDLQTRRRDEDDFKSL